MAGYNGRGSDVQSNATAVNDQIIRQRRELNTTGALGLSEEDINNQHKPAMGISRNQTKFMFDKFNGQQIMEDSYNVFLADISASTHPDFPVEFKPSLFKSNTTLMDEAGAKLNVEAIDAPSLGKGPNLKAQNIDDVIAGNIQVQENETTNLPGGRGFGVTHESDKNLTMGSYFKNRYSVDSQPRSLDAVKGERSSVPGDPYDYNQ